MSVPYADSNSAYAAITDPQLKEFFDQNDAIRKYCHIFLNNDYDTYASVISTFVVKDEIRKSFPDLLPGAISKIHLCVCNEVDIPVSESLANVSAAFNKSRVFLNDSLNSRAQLDTSILNSSNSSRRQFRSSSPKNRTNSQGPASSVVAISPSTAVSQNTHVPTIAAKTTCQVTADGSHTSPLASSVDVEVATADETSPKTVLGDGIETLSQISPIHGSATANTQTFKAPHAVSRRLFVSGDAHGEELEWTIKGAANTHFNVPNLHGYQLTAIKAVLSGKSVLVVQPTGSGKSLIYQTVPFLKHGKTAVVIMPTVALMTEQQKALESLNVSCFAFGCGKSADEIRINFVKFLDGDFRVVFMSPEWLFQSKQRIQSLQQLADSDMLSVICVDEIHCFFSWILFRPLYGQLARLREDFPSVPLLLMTATARESTIVKIKEDLLPNDPPPSILVASVDRPNISLAVIDAESISEGSGKAHSVNPTLAQLNESGGANQHWFPIAQGIAARIGSDRAIIYVDCVSNVQTIVACLNQLDVVSAAYTGKGSSTNDKAITIERWMSDEVQVIVATTAFGMGMNKCDVRHIFRVNLPSSLEELVQEIGRAGRDGKPASFTLIFDDMKMLKMFCKGHEDSDKLKLITAAFHECWMFANTDSCLRQFILNAFHPSSSHQACASLGGQHCRNCLNESMPTDVTAEIKCALACVQEIGNQGCDGEETGRGFLKMAMFITGSADKKLTKDTIFSSNLQLFGSGKRFLHTQAWWISLLKKAAAKGIFDMHYSVARHVWFWLTVNEEGKRILAQNDTVFVRFPETASATTSRESRKPLSVKVEAMLALPDQWTIMDCSRDYKFPGINVDPDKVSKMLFIPDFTQLPQTTLTSHFMWDDMQISHKGKPINTPAHCVDVACPEEGNVSGVNVRIRSSACNGVFVCAATGCEVAMPLATRKNKCRRHPLAALQKSDDIMPCPVRVFYIWPDAESDKRRWVIALTDDGRSPTAQGPFVSLHNHPFFESEHKLPVAVKQSIQTAAVQVPMVTSGQLLRGVGQAFSPVLVSSAASARFCQNAKLKAIAKLQHALKGSAFLDSFDDIARKRIEDNCKIASDPSRLEDLMYVAFPYVRGHYLGGTEDDFKWALCMSPLQSVKSTVEWLAEPATTNPLEATNRAQKGFLSATAATPSLETAVREGYALDEQMFIAHIDAACEPNVIAAEMTPEIRIIRAAQAKQRRYKSRVVESHTDANDDEDFVTPSPCSSQQQSQRVPPSKKLPASKKAKTPSALSCAGQGATPEGSTKRKTAANVSPTDY